LNSINLAICQNDIFDRFIQLSESYPQQRDKIHGRFIIPAGATDSKKSTGGSLVVLLVAASIMSFKQGRKEDVMVTQISQDKSRLDTSFLQSSAQHPTFLTNFPLTYKPVLSYASFTKKQCLIRDIRKSDRIRL
jgi:hypothetical protein